MAIMEQLVTNRRSCRRFLDKDVDPTVVTGILKAMEATPTGGNCQSVEHHICLLHMINVPDPGLKSVAFCCISTGVFRFPNERAGEIAVETVTEWMSTHPGRMERVMNIDKNYKTYRICGCQHELSAV